MIAKSPIYQTVTKNRDLQTSLIIQSHCLTSEKYISIALKKTIYFLLYPHISDNNHSRKGIKNYLNDHKKRIKIYHKLKKIIDRQSQPASATLRNIFEKGLS